MVVKFIFSLSIFVLIQGEITLLLTLFKLGIKKNFVTAPVCLSEKSIGGMFSTDLILKNVFSWSILIIVICDSDIH